MCRDRANARSEPRAAGLGGHRATAIIDDGAARKGMEAPTDSALHRRERRLISASDCLLQRKSSAAPFCAALSRQGARRAAPAGPGWQRGGCPGRCPGGALGGDDGRLGVRPHARRRWQPRQLSSPVSDGIVSSSKAGKARCHCPVSNVHSIVLSVIAAPPHSRRSTPRSSAAADFTKHITASCMDSDGCRSSARRAK